MARTQNPFVPWRQPIADRLTLIIPQIWETFFRQQWLQVLATATVAGTTTAQGQNASIAATAIPVPPLDGGMCRVTYRARVTTSAGGTSGLQVTIGWVEGGVAQSIVGPNKTTNATTTHDEAVLPIKPDDSTDVTYAITYASTGVPAMRYDFDIALETIPTVTQS